MEALIVVTGILEKIILVFMIGLSIWSVSIMVDRRRTIKQLINPDDFEFFKNQILKNELTPEARSGFYAEAMKILGSVKPVQGKDLELAQMQIDREISYYLKDRRQTFNKNLYVLASLGSNAPFIGLFGQHRSAREVFRTVLGPASGRVAEVARAASQARHRAMRNPVHALRRVE